MNRIVNLSLKLHQTRGGWFIQSTFEDVPAELPIDAVDLTWLTTVSLRDMDTESSKRLESLIHASVLGEGGWGDLEEIVDAESQLEAERTHCVQLCLKFWDDLRKVPWEVAFVEGEFGRMVSVVRVRESQAEDLIPNGGVSVGLIEALTLDEKERFARPLRQLKGKNARPVITPPTRTRALKVLKATQPETFDLLHFSGHGSTNGLMLFEETAWQHSRDRGDESATASAELSSHEFCQLVANRQARLVVVAACGDPGEALQWSLAEQLIGVPSVKAVVAMREPIEAGSLARFCGDLYERLMNDEPLDTAVLRARGLLGTARSIPQLHLNVTGDLRVWRKPLEVLPVPVTMPVPELTKAHPLPLVSSRDRLWQVKCNSPGRWQVYLLGAGAPGIAPAGSTVVVSPDARVAAAITGDRVDIAWLVQSSMNLKPVPWAPEGGVELPEHIAGRNARLLAAALLQDSTVRLLVATDSSAYWLFAARDPAGTVTWRGLHTVARERVDGALDVLPRPILISGRELNDPESRPPVFEGDPAAAMVDYAWFGDGRVAAVATVGTNGTIRVARDHSAWDWQPVTLADSDTRGSGVRGVAVVRQYQTPAGSARGTPNTPLVAVVDAEGRVHLIEVELGDRDSQSDR